MINVRYKAKRIDNEQWIEGYLIAYDGIPYIIPQEEINATIDVDDTLHNCAAFEVDPTTVMLYMQMKDESNLWVNIKQLMKGWSENEV